LASQDKRRILVVDDQPDITIALKIGLEVNGGFDVDTFTDPKLALSSFKPNIYHLVILDIVMPKMDGFELYEELKKVDPGFKVCFLTASEMYHEEMREGKYSDLDNELFIQKPIPTDDLIRKINNKIGSTYRKQ
jgi:DNA-binding NtrC family response regulator